MNEFSEPSCITAATTIIIGGCHMFPVVNWVASLPFPNRIHANLWSFSCEICLLFVPALRVSESFSDVSSLACFRRAGRHRVRSCLCPFLDSLDHILRIECSVVPRIHNYLVVLSRLAIL